MRLSQVIRDRFDEITKWRSTGMQWSDVDTQIRELGLEPKGNSVRRLYYRELTRRKSPKRQDAFSWVSNHYEAIQRLLDKSYDWPTILIHLQPGWDAADTLPTLNRVIAEFNAIDQARVRTHPNQSSPSQQFPATSPEVPSPTSLAIPESATIANSSAPKTPRDQKLTPAPNEVQAEPETGTTAAVIKEYGPRKQEKPRRPAYVKPQPRHDPYISGPRLLGSYIEAQKQADELYHQMRQASGDEEKELMEQREAIGSQADQLKVDFDHRFSSDRATLSKLYILATAALACGAFLVVDQESDRSIKLCGYDRPDHIDDMQEVPDPLFIEENLTPQEYAKIAQAYLQDKESFPRFIPGEPTPTRHLAEALVVRGEYLERRGWYEYDKIVKLDGNDLPSPSLTGTIYLHPIGHYIELNPPLTGDEPLKPDNTNSPPLEIRKRGHWR